jgi:hypothetical protein
MAKRILFVAENEKDSRSNREILSNLGKYTVAFVQRGDTAEFKLEEEKYDGIYIFDMRVPRNPCLEGIYGNGNQLVKVAREKGLPVLVLYPSSMENEETKTLRTMKADILRIPAGIKDILGACRKTFG